jgi:uncharacterized membrane protein
LKGDVLGFDLETNTGAISGRDGRRYEFVRMDWRGAGLPAPGHPVDFVAEGSRATQIYLLAQQFDPQEATTANTVYILYLVGLIVPLTPLVGLIIAYVHRHDAPDSVQSHYRFQIRTFWIGVLYSVIGIITCFILVGFFWLCFVLVWWVVRCVKGMQAVAAGAPYERPETWIW